MSQIPPTAGPNEDDKPSKKRFQERLIAELLNHGTVAAAASRAGVSRATAQRWMRQPAFQRRYRQAREAAIAAAVGLLHANTGTAVDSLMMLLADDATPPAVKVSAANSVLAWSAKFTETLDVQARLDALEAKHKSSSLPR